MVDRLARIVTAVAFSLLIAVSPALPQAALLPNAKQTFVDQNGKPLTNGKVFFYVPNTTQKKTTWSDSGETTPNTNPVILDAAGRAVIYGQGTYQQVLQDANNNQVWSAPTTAWNSAAPSGATGTDTAPIGTIIPFSGFSLPVNWAYTDGSTLNRVTYSDLFSAITISGTTVSCTSGSPVLGGWASTSQLRVGAPIEATCIPSNTTIVAITSASTITVSNNAASTAIVTATAFPWGNGDGTTTFNLPDLRGRVPAGADSMNGTAANQLQVSTTINTTSGLSVAAAPASASITSGMGVTAAGVPNGATVSGVYPTSIVGTTFVTGSTTATVADASKLIPGMTITSPWVTPGTTISSISGTSITMSAPALALTVLASSYTGASTLLVDANDIPGVHSTMSVSGANLTGTPSINAVNNGTQIVLGSNATGSGQFTLSVSGTTTSINTTFSAGTNVPVVLSANATATATGVSATFQTFKGANAAGASGGDRKHVLTAQESAPLTYNPVVTITGVGSSYNTFGASSTGNNSFASTSDNGSGSFGVLTDRMASIGISMQTNAGGAAFSALPPILTVNYIIKIKANTTGAGGVVSLGGLFGDIAVDNTLQAYTVGTTNYVGIANAANHTFLANISGSTAQPTPTAWSAWMDSECGSAQGSIATRGLSAWTCLAPGPSGYALASQGAGADIHWVAQPGTGTVTSVGLSLPSIFTVSGSPVTTVGTLTGTLATQTANTVWAGPTTGSPAQPSFRALTQVDLPAFGSGDVSFASGGGVGTIANNAVTNAKAAQMTANTVKGNSTASTANAQDMAMPSCSSATSALQWTTNTGFGCGTIAQSGTYILSHVTGSWVCTAPDGSTVSTAGTTTSGVQECINAMQTAASGHNSSTLRALCQNTTLTATTPITFGPASDGYNYDLRGCVLSTTALTSVLIDTFTNGAKLDWSAGKILCGAASGYCVTIAPTNPDPVNGSYFFQLSRIDLPYIQSPSGACTAGSISALLRINMNASAAGQVNNNIINVNGVDGGPSFCPTDGVKVEVPNGASNAIVQNVITIPVVTNFKTNGIEECNSTTNTKPCGTNIWNVAVTTGTAVTNMIISGALENLWHITSLSVNAGSCTNGMAFVGGGTQASPTGAHDNYVEGQQIFDFCTTPWTDTGFRNGGPGMPWIGYTPSVACTSGSLSASSASGQYRIPSTRTMEVLIQPTVTTIGTCASALTVTTPYNVGANATIAGINAATNTSMVAGSFSVGTNVFTVTKYDGTLGVTSGQTLLLKGSLRMQ